MSGFVGLCKYQADRTLELYPATLCSNRIKRRDNERSKRKTLVPAAIAATVTVTMTASTARTAATVKAPELPGGVGRHRFWLSQRCRLPYDAAARINSRRALLIPQGW